MEKFIRKIPILFENEHCLVLNKPARLAVQGGEGVRISLDSILSEEITPRPLLVHRLDRDTSGIILVAKTKAAAAEFSAIFAGGGNALPAGSAEKSDNKRNIIKQYMGVCSGIPKQESGVIKLKLDIRGSEKESITRYRLISSGAAGEFPCSLLELELGTGRMHQIRRHLSGIGHPLLGDDKYGDFSLNKKLRKAFSLKNLLLHASRLVMPNLPGLLPEGLDIMAPLPEYFFSLHFL